MRDHLQAAARELRDAAARIDTLIAGSELTDNEKVTALAGDLWMDANAVAAGAAVRIELFRAGGTADGLPTPI
jgi:hypothetical protein